MKRLPLSLVVVATLLGISATGCVIDRRSKPLVTPQPVASADGRNPFSKIRFPFEVHPPSRPAQPSTPAQASADGH